MEKIRKAITSRTGFTILSNIATVLVSVGLFRPYWEEIDDIWIAALTEGAFGDYEPHVLFSNIIYGKVLCGLQSIIPGIRWHAILEILFAFIVSTAFVYVLAKDKRGRIISCVFLMGSAYEIYVALQFSKIPAFISVAGYMILFELVADNDLPPKVKRALCATSYIALLFAMMLRIDAFLLGTMVAGIYGIICVIKEIMEKEFALKFKRYCSFFVPVAVMLCLCVLADYAGYRDSDWGRFKEYQKLEHEMTDCHYDALMYDDHGDELEDIGVSENDAFMFVTWQFGDDEYLTPDLINKINSISPKGIQKINTEMLKAWIANIHETICVISPLVMALVMALCIFLAHLISNKNRWFGTAVALAQAVTGIAVLFYYQYSGRWNHRAVFALLLAQFVLFIYLIYSNECRMGRELTVCMAGIILFAIGTQRLTNEFDYQEYKRTVFDHSQALSCMQDNKDRLFVTDTFTLQGFDKYNVFRASAKGQFDNMALVGGCYTNSPVAKKITRAFGYENTFRALEGRDESVILIDNLFPDRKITYCNEHGDGGEYALKELETVGGLRMYNVE